ncbi:hypothetical protein HI806_13040 [Ralstonia solanacearum]|nr:hypothetical protein BCR16_12635 [Ralstonia solanacearum FJAT-1458]QKL72115.1 hypothetical protein HI806_13040 [Ralstonia solanacearum]QKL77320.1 hypothetical protein HI805_13050 [Ralstonia solanacearum]QKL82526.1 hypothetical protein HI804_13050 [Ralstonia solanacearum]QKL87736.1 hypothetical protein HI803_13055 [Ralstonia solanacearum]
MKHNQRRNQQHHTPNCDTNRTHTVGLFLRANPDAKKVLDSHRREVREFFSLGVRATMRGVQ